MVMKRDETIQVRTTEEEKAQIEQAKERAGYASLSEFIRTKMLDFSRKLLR